MAERVYRDLDDYWGEPSGQPKTFRKEVKVCTKCDCTPLYWWSLNDRWLLHHYDVVADEMIIHECGLDIDDLPSGQFPWPKSYDGPRPPKVGQRKPSRALFPDRTEDP